MRASLARVNKSQTTSTHREGVVGLRCPFDDNLGVADMWGLPKEGFYFRTSMMMRLAMGTILAGPMHHPEALEQAAATLPAAAEVGASFVVTHFRPMHLDTGP